MSQITETKQRIIDTIQRLGRPGTDEVLAYLNSSSYFKRGCYSHHKENGGLATHSMEVYDYMLAHQGRFDADSIAVVALFHDLGKTRRSDGRSHGRRSVDILTELGYQLSMDERIAIGLHHDRSVESLRCPLRRLLTAGDCHSTGSWKRAHRQHQIAR